MSGAATPDATVVLILALSVLTPTAPEVPPRVDLPTAIRFIVPQDARRGRLSAAMNGTGPRYYLRDADIEAARARLRAPSA